MTIPNPNSLPVEMRAMADPTRHVREQVRFLLRQHDPRIDSHPAAWVVAAHSEEVAAALGVLADKLSGAGK